MAVFRRIPRLYPILDAGLIAQAGLSFENFALELRDAGIRFLQYRDKDSSDSEVLDRAALLRSIFPLSDSCLVLNDRVSLVASACFDGVHVGQGDLPPAQARAILGKNALIGFSTHNRQQALSANEGDADYIAIGPIFATSSKKNPDPVVGLAGIRTARSIANKPLVAIGGIVRANCSDVLNAGADSVAVISDLLPQGGNSARNRVEEFLRRLGPWTQQRENDIEDTTK